MGTMTSSTKNSEVVLNQGFTDMQANSKIVQQDGIIVMEKLERLMRKLRGEFMSSNGKTIDYDALRSSATFTEYSLLAAELNNIDLLQFTEVQRKAFFINLYNLVTVHALTMLQSTTELSSLSQLKNFWKTMSYSVNGMIFSLDDIEHGILRGNRPHPSRAFVSRSHFSSEDPRAVFIMKEFDPRIHFALNCGAHSCPRIFVFNGKDQASLDSSLDVAAEAFCAENFQLCPERNQIKLSKIFDWYGADFGKTMEKRFATIAKWLNKDDQQILQSLISKRASVIFLPYNWDLNKKS